MLRRNPMVPGGRPLIAIGYKYNVRKVISFIVTDNSGITQEILTCLFKYTDQFTNFSITLLISPLLLP